MAALNDIINGSKIPDPIKLLPSYDGDSQSLHHWLTQVESVLEVFDDVRVNHAAIYTVWLGVIRAKIHGTANEALVMRNVGNNWADIRTVLVDFFADRRDLSTLCQQIPYLKQKNKKVEEFYKEVQKLSASINQKIALDARYVGHVPAVMTFVSEITKNAFVDGLNDPFNLTVRGVRPASLEEAKSAAEEQFQSVERNKKFNSFNTVKSGQSAQNFQKSKFQNRSPFLGSQNQQQPSTSAPYQQQQTSPAQYQQPRPNPAFKNNPSQRNNFIPRPNFPRQEQFQSQSPIENDPPARSRQISQPMSGISYRSRNHQIANAEQTPDECSYLDEQTENYEEEIEQEFPDDDNTLNFHLASEPTPTG